MIAQSPANVDCIAFVEMSRYDEATSVLGVVQTLTEDQLKAMTESDLDSRLKAALESDAIKENAPSKLFQTELQWGALLLVRHGSDLQDEYVFITSEAVIAPQVLSQTTAATIAQSIITASIARLPARTWFSWRLRLVTSDRYCAQLAVEVGVQSARKDWSLLHCACEVQQVRGLVVESIEGHGLGHWWDDQAATVPPPGRLDEGVPANA